MGPLTARSASRFRVEHQLAEPARGPGEPYPGRAGAITTPHRRIRTPASVPVAAVADGTCAEYRDEVLGRYCGA